MRDDSPNLLRRAHVRRVRHPSIPRFSDKVGKGWGNPRGARDAGTRNLSISPSETRGTLALAWFPASPSPFSLSRFLPAFWHSPSSANQDSFSLSDSLSGENATEKKKHAWNARGKAKRQQLRHRWIGLIGPIRRCEMREKEMGRATAKEKEREIKADRGILELGERRERQ